MTPRRTRCGVNGFQRYRRVSADRWAFNSPRSVRMSANRWRLAGSILSWGSIYKSEQRSAASCERFRYFARRERVSLSFSFIKAAARCKAEMVFAAV